MLDVYMWVEIPHKKKEKEKKRSNESKNWYKYNWTQIHSFKFLNLAVSPYVWGLIWSLHNVLILQQVLEPINLSLNEGLSLTLFIYDINHIWHLYGFLFGWGKWLV